MYIFEGVNGKYCYAIQKEWNKSQKQYHNMSKSIGQIAPDGILNPNKYLSMLFVKEFGTC